MDECAHLVAMAKRAEAAEQRAAKAEAQERHLVERIHGTAQGGGLVRRVEELEAALRELDREHRDLVMRSGLGFSCEIRDLVDAAIAKSSEPAPTPRSALCHHQDRPHCAGCPDDATCEASGREPRGTT